MELNSNTCGKMGPSEHNIVGSGADTEDSSELGLEAFLLQEAGSSDMIREVSSWQTDLIERYVSGLPRREGQGEADVVNSPNEPWHMPAPKICGQCKMKGDAASSCCARGICIGSRVQ